MSLIRYFLIGVLAFNSFSLVAFGQIAKLGAYVIDPESTHLKVIQNHPQLILDHPNALGFEVYGDAGLFDFLREKTQTGGFKAENFLPVDNLRKRNHHREIVCYARAFD